MIQDNYQYAWQGVALGFSFMSVDEVAGFHETVISIISYSPAILGLVVAVVMPGIYSRSLVSTRLNRWAFRTYRSSFCWRDPGGGVGQGA